MGHAALPAPDIPQSIDDLTPAWLTAALRAGGHLGPARVASVSSEVLGEGEGFVGQVVRLRLAYAEGDGGPDSLIAKLPTRVAENRQLGEALGAYEREIRFYRELADRVPIRKPVCFHASMDPNPAEGREKEILDFLDRLPRWICRFLVPLGMWLAARSRRRYLILLEDLDSPERHMGDQLAGCSAGEAEAILREIAGVHAAWWQHAELPELGWMPPVTVLRRYAEVMYEKGRPAFQAQFGADRSPRFLELADWLCENGSRVMQRIAARPYTLVHGDYRLDNCFLSGKETGTRVVAFDWQGVTWAPGALDLAYFISGNLPRGRAGEVAPALVGAYHEALCAGGVVGYDLESCRRDYELCLLFVAYRMIAGMHLLDFTNERGNRMVHEWLGRLDALLPDDWERRLSG